MTYITVQNLKYRYPHQEKLALDNLSFGIEKGELIGIIGGNGAGKSTLCSAVMGLVPHFYKGAYGGSIRIGIEEGAETASGFASHDTAGSAAGIEVAKTSLADLCGKVGLVFQNPFHQLSCAKATVYEEIAYGPGNLGVPREEIHSRVTRVMALLDIASLRDRNPFDLSGGQMQRVALAGILVMEPEVLVLDEPTSQLDPAGSEEVFRSVEALKKSGITILMAEQKMEKLASYCDRILLLHEGKLIDFDTPDHLFERVDLMEYGICPPLARLTARMGRGILEGYGWHGKPSGPAREIFTVEKVSFSYTPEFSVIPSLTLHLDSRSTAIVGQNGAGKTTLVKLLKGLLSPVSGKITYQKEDIAQKSVTMLAKEIGYVFQNPDDQIFKYRVWDEVMFGPLNIGMDRETANIHTRRALEMTGLSGLEEVNPYDLELSQRKMVAIASVLAMNTQVIIFDEPTMGQDYRGRETLKAIIRKLEEEGRTVLSILHDMDFVYDCFERVLVFAGGKVIADGSGDEIFCQKDLLGQAGLEPPAVLSCLAAAAGQESFSS